MDLTSLSAVKAWLNLTSTTDDYLLSRLISQVSGIIYNDLQRPSLDRRTYTELQNGVGNRRIMLRNWPVISVSSLLVNGLSIPAASGPTQNGYTLATWDGTSSGTPQEITLRGYDFCRGLNNVSITYDAGYCIQNEPHTIPGVNYSVGVSAPYGNWGADNGVTYANGTPLTAVQSNPSVGQYSVSTGQLGTTFYQFASGDSGQSVLISYSFVPNALEEACIEWIGERYRYKDRIGQSSKSLGGNETAAYSLKGMPDYVSIVLDGYKKFLPL